VWLPSLALLAAVMAGPGATAPARASTPVIGVSLPRAGGPVAGASVTASPDGGHPSLYWAGAGWLGLSAAATVPIGAILDASDGAILLSTAKDAAGAIQTNGVAGGAFSVTQTASPVVTTVLTLLGGNPGVCTGAATARTVRRLYSTGRGRLQVTASDAIATTSAADWMISDRCDGTEVSVRSGLVTVRRTRLPAGAHKRVDVVRAGTSVLFAGPPPIRSASLPAAGGPSAPRATAPASSAAAPSPASAAPTVETTTVTTTVTSTAQAPPTPQDQLAALFADVNALGLSGQPAADLDGDLQTTQAALDAGDPTAACTGLGTVGQAIFENADAPTDPVPAAAASSLLSAAGAVDVALGCPTPTAADLQASSELLAAIGVLSDLVGVDPDIVATFTSELGQVGQSFIVGDDVDGCVTLQYVSDAVGLIELAGETGSDGLTDDQGQAILGAIDPIEAQLSCATLAPISD